LKPVLISSGESSDRGNDSSESGSENGSESGSESGISEIDSEGDSTDGDTGSADSYDEDITVNLEDNYYEEDGYSRFKYSLPFLDKARDFRLEGRSTHFPNQKLYVISWPPKSRRSGAPRRYYAVNTYDIPVPENNQPILRIGTREQPKFNRNRREIGAVYQMARYPKRFPYR